MRINFLKQTMTSLRVLVVLTLLTGVLYPAAVTLLGNALFKDEANGSLIVAHGQIVGSELIAQKFVSDRYFKSRPSAAEFATMPSGASNLGPTSDALREQIQARQKIWGQDSPPDLLSSSASGLDPHLTPKGALHQVGIVAAARGLSSDQEAAVRDLVIENIEEPQLGFLGVARVNVLRLNMQLDGMFP